MKVDMKEEEEAGKENIRQLHHSTVTPSGKNNKSIKTVKSVKKFHHSTDISSNEGDRSEERRKPKKKKVSKHSISSDSSSEEEGNKSQKAQIRNITKQSTKLDFTPTTPVREVGETVTQQTDGDLPRGWQRKDNLIKETPPTPKAGRTKGHKVKTHLLNGFFQRESEEKEDTSEKEQKMNRLVKWWIGTKTFPLVDHSVNDEENIMGPQQQKNIYKKLFKNPQIPKETT